LANNELVSFLEERIKVLKTKSLEIETISKTTKEDTDFIKDSIHSVIESIHPGSSLGPKAT